MTASNASYNGSLGTGATTPFGFNGSWTGTNPAPTSFALNGTDLQRPGQHPDPDPDPHPDRDAESDHPPPRPRPRTSP